MNNTYTNGGIRLTAKERDVRTRNRNRKLARRGKFMPSLRPWQSRPMRSRQVALRRLARSKNYASKNMLSSIRSRAKYNLYKLGRRLSANVVLRHAMRRRKVMLAKRLLRRGMRRYILPRRLNELKTNVVLSRYINSKRARR